MICKDCGKAFTPLSCPSCGGALGGDSCPACNEGKRVTCTTCGQELEIARVEAEVSEGISPDGARPGEVPHGGFARGPFGGTGETMPEAMADMEASVGSIPPLPELPTVENITVNTMGGGMSRPGEGADTTAGAGSTPPWPDPPAAAETFGRAMGADRAPEPPSPFANRETMPDEVADITVAAGSMPPQPEPPTAAETFGRAMGADRTPEPAFPDGNWETMPGEEADIAVAAGEREAAAAAVPPAPQQPDTPPGHWAQPQHPPYTPPQAQGYSQQPAQPYPAQNQPYAQQQWQQPGQQQSPQQDGYGPPPTYGIPGEPYPPTYPNQPYYYPMPGQKKRLGGALMAYLVFCWIGLAFNVLNLFSAFRSYSTSAFDVILSLVFIFLAVMIIVAIMRRDINFRRWFLVRAIIGFIQAGFLIVLGVSLAVLYNSYGAGVLDRYLSEYYNTFGSYLSDYTYMLPDWIMSAAIGICIAAAVVIIAWYVCWLVYFRRSKRVAEVFGTYNHPPK